MIASNAPRPASMRRLVDFFASLLPAFPDVEAVNFGGGIPHPYRPGKPPYDLAWLKPVLDDAQLRFAAVRGRPVRVELEPGRYPVAGMGLLVSRVHDIKDTRSNDKGQGHRSTPASAILSGRPCTAPTTTSPSWARAAAAPPSRWSSLVPCARAATCSRATSTNFLTRAFYPAPIRAICSCSTTPAHTAPP